MLTAEALTCRIDRALAVTVETMAVDTEAALITLETGEGVVDTMATVATPANIPLALGAVVAETIANITDADTTLVLAGAGVFD